MAGWLDANFPHEAKAINTLHTGAAAHSLEFLLSQLRVLYFR
jgi:hypothetical protein